MKQAESRKAGPNELVTMAYVARRYYREDATQAEIAAEVGVSRFKVGRMLERAKQLGIVKFEITTDDQIDFELSLDLQSRFKLHRALVVRAPGETDEIVREYVGRAAAQLLTEIVEDGETLGFTSGRTIQATVENLQSLARCNVVALGGVAGQSTEHGVEIVRQAQRVAGGRVWPIFAPLVVRDSVTARALFQDPVIHEAVSQFSHVSKGIVAIGNWDPPSSQLYDAARELGLAEDLLKLGVLGDVAATLIAEDGSIIDKIDDRTIAIRVDQLRRIPEVIGVGGGVSKARATQAAIASGLINSLVTDTSMARQLLS